LEGRLDYRPTTRIGWELLEFSRSSLANLEENASRVVAAQTAGLIALWVALYTYEEAVPKGFGWAAWSMLLVSIAWLGRLVTPRRLARFWERCRIEGRLVELKAASYDEAEERELIQNLGETLSAQIGTLRRGTHVSIVLGLGALALAAAGYVVDKAFYAP
jgi:hypothetical protein